GRRAAGRGRLSGSCISRTNTYLSALAERSACFQTSGVIEQLRFLLNRRIALSIWFDALSYAKPLRTFAGNALLRKERGMINIGNDTHVLANELSLCLREFHRALIQAEAGKDSDLQNPYTFLFAVIGDPRFAWTNNLTQLIVKLDESIAEGEIATLED